MMRARYLGMLMSGLLLACNGGDAQLPAQRPAGTVSGQAVDGIIVDGSVGVFAFAGGVKGERLGGGTTDAEGAYQVSIRAADQPVLIEVSGGRYVEDASGTEVALGDGEVLRAPAYYRSGEPLTAMVTPLTHLAAGLAAHRMRQGEGAAAAIEAATEALEAIYGFDVVGTAPHPIDRLATGFDERQLYGFVLAGLSSWTAWAGEQNGEAAHQGFTTVGLLQILYNDIQSDGLLDGRGYNKAATALMALAFGAVALDEDVYRIGFAQHMLAVAGGPRNLSGVTLAQLNPGALRLAGSGHGLFGGQPPAASEAFAPRIAPVEPEGASFNGLFDFAVQIEGVIGAQSVVFDVDGDWVGDAPDPADPRWAIDTRAYADGEHTIGVRAVDALGNESYRTFSYRFDNIFVNVSSAAVTNQASYTVQGSYSDNGAGVASISVQEAANLANVEPDGTWSATVALQPGYNTIPIVLTTLTGGEDSSQTVVALDQAAPTIDSADRHSMARFSRGDGSYDEAALQDSNDGQPLYIETDRLDLDGVSLARSALDDNGIAYFAFAVEDPDFHGVASTADAITVFGQYERAGEVLAPWRKLTRVEGEYLLALASETLAADWHRATPGDRHRLRVRVIDEAGNATLAAFEFNADFYVPPFAVSAVEDRGHEIFTDTAFADRASLHGLQFTSTAYTFTSPADKALYLRPEDDSTHTVENQIEALVREHQIRLRTETRWRLGFITNALLYDECPAQPEWTVLSEGQQILNWVDGQWQAQPVPAAVYGPALAHDSDTLPEPENPVSAWEDVPDFDNQFYQFIFVGDDAPDLLVYEYDYVLSVPRRTLPAYVANWTLTNTDSGAVTTCPDQRFFQRQMLQGYESVEGYPRNSGALTTESKDFATTAFQVFDNDAGVAIEAVGGWYRIPAGRSITISKQVTTPAMAVYDDADVADPDSFQSYVVHRYDQGITWTVDRALLLSVAHDAGEANLFGMPVREVGAGEGARVYAIGR